MVTSYRTRSQMFLLLSALPPSFPLVATHTYVWVNDLWSEVPLCPPNTLWNYCHELAFLISVASTTKTSHLFSSFTKGLPWKVVPWPLFPALPGAAAAVVAEYWKAGAMKETPKERPWRWCTRSYLPGGDSSLRQSGRDTVFIFNSDVSHRKWIWVILKYYINTKAYKLAMFLLLTPKGSKLIKFKF